MTRCRAVDCTAEAYATLEHFGHETRLCWPHYTFAFAGGRLEFHRSPQEVLDDGLCPKCDRQVVKSHIELHAYAVAGDDVPYFQCPRCLATYRTAYVPETGEYVPQMGEDDE